MDYQNFKLTAKVVQHFETATGISAGSGKEWVKKDLLVETLDKYPKLMLLTAWGDNVLNVGVTEKDDIVDIEFIAESRAWNDKYITNLTIRQIEIQKAVNPVTLQPATKQEQEKPKEPQPSPLSRPNSKVEDIEPEFTSTEQDLPF